MVDDVVSALEEQYGPDEARSIFDDFLSALNAAVDALPQGASVSVTIPTSRVDFVLVGSRGEQLVIEVKATRSRPGAATGKKAAKRARTVKKTAAAKRVRTIEDKKSKKQKKGKDADTAAPAKPGRTDSPGPSASHEGKRPR